MKNIFYILIVLFCVLGLSSCGNDDWDYDKSLENVYFFGPQVWGYDDTKKGNNNVVFYDIEQGGTAIVPMQLWCEFYRSYDVVTYYYLTSETLALGVDYNVVDENGSVITPDALGAYNFIWKNAVKGVKNVYVKSLPGGGIGTVTLQTAAPNAPIPVNNDLSTTLQSKTADYEVRIFSQNYKVAINIQ